MAQQLVKHEQSVEVHVWNDPSEHSGLVSDFARVHVLLSIFDADIAKWLQMIERVGSPSEKLGDAPFLRSLQQRLVREPRLIDDLGRVVADFARLVTPPSRSA